ncbi:hypothetical protein OKC48_04115 [Methylorubrum extorquens]|uniref:hypothetical protein n=1 Tax=Methylorubrum extorquens TaxID=408 RepID=UPI0022385F07|nr:hypothetical protein [Methylorubrum extorquens]UYW27705.1 hypothetical protein OKC48_04115 [Methylorubrum extorquens]
MTNDVDLSHNKQLAQRARLSITDIRAQRLVANWLQRNRVNQDTIDRNRRIVETCARISGTDISKAGDWNALAHCLSMSLFQEARTWLMQQKYFFDDTKFSSTREVFEDIFGDQFVGNEFVEHFDTHGEAMMVTRSIV